MAGPIHGAVFLDRDGVINRRIVGGYVRSPDELEMFAGTAPAIARLVDAGRTVVVITNQSGIGRGIMTEEQLAAVHTHLEAALARGGARVHAIYHCPHGPDAGCDCRKPAPGMLQRAAHDHDLDLTTSYLVGDASTDIAAGHAVGATTVLVTDDRHEPYPAGAPAPTHEATDLAAAVAWILDHATS